MFEFGRFSEQGLRSITESTARLNIWEGAVRSGKTICSIVRWLEFVQTAPPGDLMMLGKTERTLSSNILNTIEAIVGPKRWKYNRGTGEATLFGRRILIRGANDGSSEAKIRGATIAGAYGDEVTLWPANIFRQLLARMSVPGAKFFGTTNPDSPFHWFKTDFLDKPGLDLRAFHFTLDDNPNLDPVYVANLKREYTGLWYKRFILGLWVMADGTVYDFDPERHVVRELPLRRDRDGNDALAFDQVRLSVDYGTSNPTVFLLLGRHERRWYVAREYYFDSRVAGRQKTDAEYADDLVVFLDKLYPQSIEVDPSAASFIVELRRRGLPVHKANNDVLDGIRVVSRALGAELLIHESCRHLIQELSVYSWDPKAQQRGEDRPVKEHDHAPDSLRYAAMRIFGRRGLPPVSKPRAA